MRHVSITFLACLLTTFALANANDQPTIRHAELGFTQQFHDRHWTPLRIEIDNPGPEHQAVVVLEPVNRSHTQPITIRKPVWLPARSHQSLWLTVLPEADDSPPPKRKPKDTEEPNFAPTVFRAKLTDGGLQVWSQLDVIGRVIPESAAIMLVADTRHVSYRIPSTIPFGWTHKSLTRTGIEPSNLPARAIDYDGIDLLVLGAPDTLGLHAMQRQAIIDWVRSGGTLLFTPSPGMTDDWLAQWQSLLPVRFFTGDRLATEPRLRRWGDPPVFPDGVHFRRMVVRDGQVLVGDNQSPLLVTRREGLGNVLVFALDTGDLTFQRWPGALNFNSELLSLALQRPTPADRILERSPATDAIVSSLAGIKVLGRRQILIYLVVLVAGILGILYACRFTRAPERGWIAVAALAVLVAGSVVVAANRWKGQPQPFLNEVNIVDVAPDAQHAVAYAALGLYSPHATKFDLTAPYSDLQLRPRTGKQVTVEPFSVQMDDQLHVTDLAVRASDMRAMYGEALLPAAPQPAARARLTAAGLEVTVTNTLAQPLQDCFIKFNRFVAPVGDLPAHTEKVFHNLQTGEAYSSRTVQTTDDELRTRIRRLFFPDPIYTLSRQGALPAILSRAEGNSPSAVYGWTTQPLFPLNSTSAGLARRGVNLWDIETSLTYTGPQITIPRGLLTMQLRTADARPLERAPGRYSGTRAGNIAAEFVLPAGCPDLRVDTARVFVNYRGSAFRYRVALQSPHANNQHALAGGPDYPIANPSQWYDPARRSFTVLVEITPASPDDALQSTGINYWQIRELDMEIGGTIQ